MSRINRRQMLSLAALGGAGLMLRPLDRVLAADAKRPKVLFLTKSSGFQHSVIARKNGELGHAEKMLQKIGADNGVEIVPTKDASLLNPDKIDQWDAIVFYTTGDLTRASNPKNNSGDEPPMSPEGKEAFLKAIANGKGFMAFHSATDTFHSPGKKDQLLRDKKYEDTRDPYIKMIGGEFVGHGSQQKAKMRFASTGLPGLAGLEDFEMHEEWYSLMNLSDDLHVILVQDTASMTTPKGPEALYKRPPYPATWARMHGKGRVFYTSMGHREDVWTNPVFQKITVAGLNWITGKTNAEAVPNVAKSTPEAVTLPGWKG